jgi:hypothetical protein
VHNCGERTSTVLMACSGGVTWRRLRSVWDGFRRRWSGAARPGLVMLVRAVGAVGGSGLGTAQPDRSPLGTGDVDVSSGYDCRPLRDARLGIVRVYPSWRHLLGRSRWCDHDGVRSIDFVPFRPRGSLFAVAAFGWCARCTVAMPRSRMSLIVAGSGPRWTGQRTGSGSSCGLLSRPIEVGSEVPADLSCGPRVTS